MATAIGTIVNASWTSTSNWTGGSGAGGIPANGDTIKIIGGTVDLTTNLTTGLTGTTFYRGKGYTGKIGSSSAYLDLDGGTAQLFCSNETWFTGTWSSAVEVIGGLASVNMCQIRANASTDIATLRVLGGDGTVTVGASAVLDDLLVTRADGVTVVVADGVTSLDNVTVNGGLVQVGADIVTLAQVRAGILSLIDTCACAQLDIDPDGTAKYTASGTITTLNVYGFFDARANATAAITLPTTATIYEGGVADLRNSLGTFIGMSWIYNGGTIYAPVGSTIAIS